MENSKNHSKNKHIMKRVDLSGYAIYLSDNLVSWCSKKHPTLSRSSCESKNHALTSTVAKVKWLTHILCDLKVISSSSLILFYDNHNSIFRAANTVSHNPSKYINLDYHFVHELVAFGDLWLQYVPTNLQLANIFTKSFDHSTFIFFRFKLRVRNSQTLGLQEVITVTYISPISFQDQDQISSL